MVVTARGRLILEHGGVLHDEVRRQAEAGARRLVVDLSAVNYIDSHGIGQMVSCHTTLRSHDGEVRFAGLQQKVFRLIEITGVPRVLHFDPDLATALGKLSGS